MRRSLLRVDPYLLLLLGLSFFALAPLTAPGYFYSAHDGRHSVFFAAMFDESIRSGALWPRWAMHHNQGYGYPTFLVQAPLAFYIAEFFVLLGVGVTNAVKIAWALGFLAGASGMYRLVRAWLCSNPSQPLSQNTPPARYAALSALVAGLLYTYAPYHLLDIYVRAAFAETMLMAWFPWVFLAFDRLISRGRAAGWQGRLLVAGLSFAGLLLTHSFAVVAFTPLLIIFVLFRLWWVWRRDSGSAWGWSESVAAAGARSPKTGLLHNTLLAGCAGLAGYLLAAIFLIPLFVEGPYLVQEEWTRETYQFSRHWVHWGQFLSPFWGFGYSDDPVGANDGMGFQLGIMLVIFAFVAVYLLWAGYIGRKHNRLIAYITVQPGDLHPLMLFLLLMALGLLMLMTPIAEGLWRSISLLAVIQFPWRLLALVAFCLSALGGLVVWQLACDGPDQQQGRMNETTLLLVALLVCFASIPYAWPQALQPVEPWREDGRAVMEFETMHPDMIATTRFVEQRSTVSPLTAQYQAADFSLDKLERLAVIAGKGEVLRNYSLGHAFGGMVAMATPGTVQIRLYEFPGWQVKVDGQPVAHRVSPPHGLIEVDLAPGEHRIDVWMGTTPARTAGAIASGTTLLALVALWLFSRLSIKERQ
jgi:hypothetical protein